MKFAISTKNEVLKFGEVRSSSSLKPLFATQALAEDLELEQEHLAAPPEPEPPLDPVDHYQELIKAVYTDKNPAKLNDLDTLFEKYNTEAKLKKMYDFIRDKYVVADAPALLAPAETTDAPPPPADTEFPDVVSM